MGAVLAAEWIKNKKGVFDIKDVFELEDNVNLKWIMNYIIRNF